MKFNSAMTLIESINLSKGREPTTYADIYLVQHEMADPHEFEYQVRLRQWEDDKTPGNRGRYRPGVVAIVFHSVLELADHIRGLTLNS